MQIEFMFMYAVLFTLLCYPLANTTDLVKSLLL